MSNRVRGGKGKGRGISRAKANAAKVACPACDRPLSRHASFSRYVNLYICSECGVQEAIRGFFWSDKFETERPSQPAGFNPYELEG